MSATVEIKGLDERIKQFGELSTENPLMRKRISAIIRKVLSSARKALQNDAQSGLGMKQDPRKAYKAVRMAVYRRILGGQVNILQSRKAGQGNYYEPPRKLRAGQRGGNRAKQSERTRQLMSYEGNERGFILRFLNDGTGDRAIHSMGDKSLNRGSVSILKTKGIGGNRGSIQARHWFGGASQAELERAAQELDDYIDKLINGIL